MVEIIMYSSQVCPYCVRAEKLLITKGVTTINKIMVDGDPKHREEMIQRTGKRTVPQIFINGQYIGGCDDLYALDRQGGLDPLLAA